MTKEEFAERVESYKKRYNYPDIILIKGAIAFMARMCIMYPEEAKEWYDSLPKATMD